MYLAYDRNVCIPCNIIIVDIESSSNSLVVLLSLCSCTLVINVEFYKKNVNFTRISL